jgi:ubiquinone/menaquinone biosynthesis C-methylase UbiE
MNKNIFINCEGNNWFLRNKDIILQNKDIILQNFDVTKYNNMNILEVGCSNGWRLNELYNINHTNNYYGFDPSEDSIKYGLNNFKDINLFVDTIDNINLTDNFCDIILIPFVFMYVDRNLLLKSIAEIDRILKNNGLLIITDFYSNRQRKNLYKHIQNMYIYKQNYYEIFLSTKNYFLNKLLCFSHNTTNDNDDYDDTCYYIELKKDICNLFN